MRLVLTTILTILTFSLFSQSKLELNLNSGIVILNEHIDSNLTNGGQYDIGARYVLYPDTTDSFFALFAGLNLGLFRFKSELDKNLYQNFSIRAYIGFTPVDDVWLSFNGQYHLPDNSFVPTVRVEAQPFTRFLWTDNTKAKMTFYLEGGYIKYLEKSNSPIAFVSFGAGLLF